MTPLSLRQSGEYDFASEVSVHADGQFHAEHGGYVTAGVRTGRLSARDQRRLQTLAAAIDLDATYPLAPAAVSTLTVGERSTAWSGAPPTAEIAALVGALARL